jgi:hypothetical protein
VHVQVGVDSARKRAADLYDGQGHPFLSLGQGVARTRRDGGREAVGLL